MASTLTPLDTLAPSFSLVLSSINYFFTLLLPLLPFFDPLSPVSAAIIDSGM